MSQYSLCLVFIWKGTAWYGSLGAAVATTTIGRGTGVLYQCYHLFYKKGIIQLKAEILKSALGSRGIDRHSLACKRSSLYWPGSWIVLARLVAETGSTTASAGYQVASRNVVIFLFFRGLSSTAATLVGTKPGANQPDRCRTIRLAHCSIQCIFYELCYSAFVFFFFFFPYNHYFSNEAEVIRIGTQALRIIGTGYIFLWHRYGDDAGIQWSR